MKLQNITIKFEEKIATRKYQNTTPSIVGTFEIDQDQIKNEEAQVKEAVRNLLQYFEHVKEEALEAAGGKKVITKTRKNTSERWEFDELKEF